MRKVPASQIVGLIQGSVGIRKSDAQIQPLRLSESWAEFGNPALFAAHVAEASNGIRISFAAGPNSLEIDFQLVISERTEYALQAGATAPPTVDLRVDGKLHDRRILDHSAVAQRLRFENLPGRPAEVIELWLPHNVGINISSISSDSELTPPIDNRPRWVFHGSSITHDALAPGPSQTWPARLAHNFGWHLTQLGFRGECHLDYCVAKALASLPADGLVLELGINVHNFQTYSRRTFSSAVHSFLETIRLSHPTVPILVIAPIFGAEREAQTQSTLMDGQVILGDLNLRMIRADLKAAVEARVGAGDKNLFYLSGLELLGEEDAELFPDGLHPNLEGTKLLERRLIPTLQSLLS